MPGARTGESREAVDAFQPYEGDAMAYDVITMGRIGVDLHPLRTGVPLPQVTFFGGFPGGSAAGAAGAPPIASGAGDRLALAGAKCERRLPARRGPAPEVPPQCHVSTRGPERPTLCRARPAARPWWDGPVAGAAARRPAAGAHELHERHVSTRRRHL